MKDTTQKKSLINQILQTLADSLNKPKEVPIEKQARIAYEFKQLKLYPSSDAIELTYILNPWLNDVRDTIAPGRTFRIPVFPWTTGTQRKAMRDKFKADSKSNPQSNVNFNSLASAFENTLPSFVETYQSLEGIQPLLDTLRLFDNRVIPALKQRLPSLCKGKVDYLNNNFEELVNTMKDVTHSKYQNVSYISYIIQDFFTTANFSGTTYNNFKNKENAFTFSNAVYVPGDHSNYIHEVKFDGDNSVATKALKCRIYVYDQDGKPISGRFKIYLAPYITTYNLADCRDTIQYLLTKSATSYAGPACTAAASICNNSNWALYAKDNTNLKTYLVDEEYNFQNIIDRDEADESSFKICIVFHGK